MREVFPEESSVDTRFAIHDLLDRASLLGADTERTTPTHLSMGPPEAEGNQSVISVIADSHLYLLFASA